tara:strand:+ start:1806 stop:2264 length:459 start_codon:yes stop_codon:yes gene_type:complete
MTEIHNHEELEQKINVLEEKLNTLSASFEALAEALELHIIPSINQILTFPQQNIDDMPLTSSQIVPQHGILMPFPGPIDLQNAFEELHILKETSQAASFDDIPLTDLVTAAKPVDSVLHNAFDWNDEEDSTLMAGWAYNLLATIENQDYISS